MQIGNDDFFPICIYLYPAIQLLTFIFVYFNSILLKKLLSLSFSVLLYGLVWCQNRDYILDQRRLQFESIHYTNQRIWISGFCENMDTFYFEPILAEFGEDLSLRKFHALTTDTGDIITIGKLVPTYRGNFAFITNGMANYYREVNSDGVSIVSKKHPKFFGSGVEANEHWYEGFSGSNVDSGYYEYGYNNYGRQLTGLVQKFNRFGDIEWTKRLDFRSDTSTVVVGVYDDNKRLQIGYSEGWGSGKNGYSTFSLSQHLLNGSFYSRKRMNVNKFNPTFFLIGEKNFLLLGGVKLIGDFLNLGVPSRCMIMKTDSNLNPIWEIDFGDSLNLFNKINKIIRLSDGHYLAAAYLSYADTNCSDCTEFMKFSESGQILWRKRYKHSPPSLENTDEIKDMIELPNGDIVGIGNTTPNSLANSDTFRVQRAWILKINKSGEVLSSITPYANLVSDIISLYPNPASTELIVKIPNANSSNHHSIQLYDMLGREHNCIQTQYGSALNLKIDQLPTGIYLLKVIDKEGIMLHTERVEIRR